jgi:hypothetical protein
MRTSFHHQPEAQHPNFQLSTSWQADYPIFRGQSRHSASDYPSPSDSAPFTHLDLAAPHLAALPIILP